MKSPHCQMNQNNLARVFGPTVVGHGLSEPSPTTIMRDSNTQPKVSVLSERNFSWSCAGAGFAWLVGDFLKVIIGLI